MASDLRAGARLGQGGRHGAPMRIGMGGRTHSSSAAPCWRLRGSVTCVLPALRAPYSVCVRRCRMREARGRLMMGSDRMCGIRVTMSIHVPPCPCPCASPSVLRAACAAPRQPPPIPTQQRVPVHVCAFPRLKCTCTHERKTGGETCRHVTLGPRTLACVCRTASHGPTAIVVHRRGRKPPACSCGRNSPRWAASGYSNS